MITFLSTDPFYLLQAAVAAFTLLATLTVALAAVHEAKSAIPSHPMHVRKKARKTQ
jgi:hypothetical protein